MKKTIFILSLVSTLGFIAEAGRMGEYQPIATPQTPRAASDYVSSFSGKALLGYDSTYTYKNIAVSDDLNASGMFYLGGEVNLPFLSNMQQHISARYMDICDGYLSEKDAFDARWSADKEVVLNLRAGLGYTLNYGGFPGCYAKAMGKAPHSLAQAIDAYATYDDPGHGYFGTVALQYGFYGLTGWRVDLQAGKRWTGVFTQQVDAELSAGTGYSWSYWGHDTSGFDQVNIKLAAPVRLWGGAEKDRLKVIPFIQTIWAGDTRKKVRDYAGSPMFESFQIVAGVQLTYTF